MKKIIFTLLIITSCICILTSCILGNDEDIRTVNTSLCLSIMNSNGTDIKELSKEFNAKFAFFVENDTKLLLLNHDLLRILDIETLTVEKQLDLPFNFIESAEVSFDKTMLAFGGRVSDTFDIYLTNLDSLSLTKLTEYPEISGHNPSFSHDDKQVVYAAYSENSQAIVIHSIEDHLEVSILPSSFSTGYPKYYYPKFDADDNAIYYLSRPDKALFVVAIDSGHLEKLVDNLEYRSPIRISDNGEQVLFVKDEEHENIMVFNLLNLHIVEVLNSGHRFYETEYSIVSDGTKIAYSKATGCSYLDGEPVVSFVNYEVWTADADDTNKRKVANGRYPKFSSDGTKIVFQKMIYD